VEENRNIRHINKEIRSKIMAGKWKKWTTGTGHDSKESAQSVVKTLKKEGRKAKSVKVTNQKKWHVYYI